jgi:hypothetical protein
LKEALNPFQCLRAFALSRGPAQTFERSVQKTSLE